jgi:hypothetical protein
MPNIREYRLKLVTLKEVDEILAVFDEIVEKYDGYEFERSVIELINYHEKCAV